MRSERILGGLDMSFSEWREVKLEDIIEIEMGQSPKSEFYNQTGEGLPFLQGNRTFGDKYPYFDTYCTENKKIANKNDVIMSVRAPVGDLNIAQTQISLGRGVCAMRLKGEQNSNYLFYLMKHNIKEMINRESGTVFGSVNKKDILGLDVKITNNKLEQKAIAHILSTLDDKIEVNNQINKTLENMAHAYFDDMFPNVAAGDTTIGEYITPKRGKNLLSKDAISGEVPVIAGGLSPATYHNVSNTQSPVITISASGANAGFVNLWTVPVWSSDSSFIDYGMTKDVYFWYVMLKKRQKEIYDSQTGSAQPHIYPKHITIMPTIKLNVDEINLYTKRVTPLFKKIANNLYEISKLQLIRDTLLPKLMSGKIRVPLDSEGDVS